VRPAAAGRTFQFRPTLVKYLTLALFVIACLFCWISCEKGLTSAPFPNQPPETQLFIQPTTAGFDTTFSTQILHWWGSDADGEVIGYYYQWNYFTEIKPDSFVWTTAEYDTFNLPIRQLVDDFWIKVKAVDNSAEWNYQEPTKSGIDQEYFSDVGNEYRIYDSLDVVLSAGLTAAIQTPIGSTLTTLRGDEFYNLPPTDTSGAVDRSPAYALFPIKNSPPEVSFVYSSNPSDTVAVKTFTTRTFNWVGDDPDGTETLTYFYYALSRKGGLVPQTVAELQLCEIHDILAGSERSVTLRNIPEGEWVFYLVVEDIAGQSSSIIRFPQEQGTWTVESPKIHGTLFIDDYAIATDGDVLYPEALNEILGQDNYSVWHIENRIPYSKIDIEETLGFFDYIVYYADGQSHLPNMASQILNYYIRPDKNHHILISSITATDNNDSLFAFLSSDYAELVADRYSFQAGDYRIGPGQVIYSRDPDYVDLQVTPGKIISNPDGLIVGADADTLYQLPASSRGEWPGEPVIGIKYPIDQPAKLIFLSFTLHNSNGYSNIKEVLREFLGK